VSIVVALGVCAAGLSASAPVLQSVTGLSRVARLAGQNTINNTDTRWNVAGTDLGHMFDMGDRLYMVFGDTFGQGFVAPPGAGASPDWRTNVMAVTTDRDPSDGLTFDSMFTDRPDHAREIISPRRDLGDVTNIPTNGIAVGTRMYLHYMAVSQWKEAGAWDLRVAGLAYSANQGQTWTKLAWTWPSDTNFGQVAFVRDGGFVYLFGIPGGRNGGVCVARVPEDKVTTQDAYRYYAGKANGEPVWSTDEKAAVQVVAPPVGELSVMWNGYLGRWIMMYLGTPGIVIREAPSLLGLWSAPKTVVPAFLYPGLYAPYMHPWLTENNGETIYFTMSEWGTYTVSLMKVKLVRRSTAITMADVARALMIAGGLATATQTDTARLGKSATEIDLTRATALLRESTGLD
jgi:hypothetical protein